MEPLSGSYENFREAKALLLPFSYHGEGDGRWTVMARRFPWSLPSSTGTAQHPPRPPSAAASTESPAGRLVGALPLLSKSKPAPWRLPGPTAGASSSCSWQRCHLQPAQPSLRGDVCPSPGIAAPPSPARRVPTETVPPVCLPVPLPACRLGTRPVGTPLDTAVLAGPCCIDHSLQAELSALRISKSLNVFLKSVSTAKFCPSADGGRSLPREGRHAYLWLSRMGMKVWGLCTGE